MAETPKGLSPSQRQVRQWLTWIDRTFSLAGHRIISGAGWFEQNRRLIELWRHAHESDTFRRKMPTRSIASINLPQIRMNPMYVRRKLAIASALFLPFVVETAVAKEPARAVRPPNVVFLIADDLGYGDVGAFGQKIIKTPTLDKLAAEGMKLTKHYSGNAVCAPSRCVLMTGLHPGHAQIRDNREIKPEGQYPLVEGTRTLARILKENGYATGGFGKWGLGYPGSDGRPTAQGFDRFFGYNCQAKAHNHFPAYLWDNDSKVELANPAFAAHQKLPADVDRNDPKNYAPYAGREYGMDFISAQAAKFVEANRDKPFFLFYPTTVPHLALQVPADSLKPYESIDEESTYDGSRGYLPNARPRATYAAMVSRMDASIGAILGKIDELGLTDDTIVVFTSDNGPLYDRLGGTDTDFFRSALEMRGRKGSLYEGGVRVPTIVKAPGRIKPGSESAFASGFEDWLPTILSLAGLSSKTPEGLDGRDISATLQGGTQPARDFLYREFPGYGGQQAVWAGKWKAVRQNLHRAAGTGKAAVKKKAQAKPGPIRTELYDLEADPTESKDLAADHPDVVARLEAIMKAQHVPSQIFPIRDLDGPN
jgi:arylsulfatase A-like enzyme